MKKLKHYLSIVMVFTMVVSMLAACGTSDSTNGDSGQEGKKKLVMGTSADYPPYEYIDTASGSDEIIGFDPEVAKHIANELGYELEIKNISFKGLIPALKSERVDFVLAGMTPTEERKKSVDFSDVYYRAQQWIMTTNDSGIKTIEDLKGKTVGVQLGSIQEAEATKIKEDVGIEIKKLNEIPGIVQELKSGRIDAMIIEDAVALGHLQENPELTSFEIPNPVEQSAGSAIAFPKGSDLTDDFNKALNDMMENGELDKLVKKWFNNNQQ